MQFANVSVYTTWCVFNCFGELFVGFVVCLGVYLIMVFYIVYVLFVIILFIVHFKHFVIYEVSYF